MLNKICQKEGIAFSASFKREEQANLLKAEGAENVLITTGDWEPQYKEYIGKGFGCIFDAIGEEKIQKCCWKACLRNRASGYLEGKPLVFNTIKMIKKGLNLESFITGRWWMSAPEETKVRVRVKYSSNLMGEFSTKLFKELALPMDLSGL